MVKELMENELASLRTEEEQLAATAVLLGKGFAAPPLYQSGESDDDVLSDTDPDSAEWIRASGGVGGLTRKEKKAIAARKARKRSRAHLHQVETETLRLQARVAALKAVIRGADENAGKRQRLTGDLAGRLGRPSDWLDDID
jgi:hypothetical protein